MSYEICKRCKKMFEKSGGVYCRDCFEKNQGEYRLITEHIRKYPNATVMDIITKTGVSFKTINCLIEDGDISYVENKLTAEDIHNDFRAEHKTSVKRSKFHLTRK